MIKNAGLVLGLAILLMVSYVNAADDYDLIVVNSEDWVDIYSAAAYANLLDKDFNYLAGTEQVNLLPAQINAGKIYLLESAKKPVVKGYASNLRNAGFEVYEEIITGNLNLELARKTNGKKFILVDDTYGYNALSVLPYARLTNSYVLIAQDENIGEISGFLEERKADALIYGHMRNTINYSATETIDSGDKFEDNIAIVKKYRELRDTGQVTLTDGSFMEIGIMTGVEPILFIGRDATPEHVVSYVEESDIKVGVLVGNDLIPNAQSLKAKTGISVFLKFGQGMGSGMASSNIRDLDLYYFPENTLNMSTESIDYNILTDELEVVYSNPGEAFAYFKSTLRLYSGGELVEVVGETESALLDAGEKKGLTYPIDPAGKELRDLKAEVFLQYGESKKSLDRTTEYETAVGVSEAEDDSSISVKKIVYDKKTEQIKITIKNEGPECYIKPRLALLLDGENKAVELEAALIGEKAEKDMTYSVSLSDEDLGKNQKVNVQIEYGQRRSFLTKSLEEDLDLTIASEFNMGSMAYPALIVLLLSVIVVLFFFVLKKEGKEGRKKRGL